MTTGRPRTWLHPAFRTRRPDELCLSTKETLLVPPQSDPRTSRLDLASLISGDVTGLLSHYRLYAPYRPKNAHNFSQHSLQLDPHARPFRRTLVWSNVQSEYRISDKKSICPWIGTNMQQGCPRRSLTLPSVRVTTARRCAMAWHHYRCLGHKRLHGPAYPHPASAARLGRGFANTLATEQLEAIGMPSLE
jgi:hypothetical protein